MEKITEFIYTNGDGKEEVIHRYKHNSVESLELINLILDLQNKHGLSCPYSFRHVTTMQSNKELHRLRELALNDPARLKGYCPFCVDSEGYAMELDDIHCPVCGFYDDE